MHGVIGVMEAEEVKVLGWSEFRPVAEFRSLYGAVDGDFQAVVVMGEDLYVVFCSVLGEVELEWGKVGLNGLYILRRSVLIAWTW